MKKPVTFIELNSEISAGTRGASLGVDAMRIAAWKKQSDFFHRHRFISVPDNNHLLARPVRHKWAKRIEGLIEVYEHFIPVMAEALRDESHFPFVLAAAHGTAGATIKAMRAAFPEERIGVIWIDAHGDLHSPYTTPSGNIHGMPLAIALQEDNFGNRRRDLDQETITLWEKLKDVVVDKPAVRAKDVVLVGARDLEIQEHLLIDEIGIRNYPVRKIREKGFHRVAADILDQLSGCDRIYVTFDVDSMDVSISEGTGTPVPGGLLKSEARGLLKVLADSPKVACIEFVEVNPCLDLKGNVMAETAFQILEEVVDVIENER